MDLVGRGRRVGVLSGLCRGGGFVDKPSAVTRGDWSREWSSQRSDEAHVTTPGGPDNRIEEDGRSHCV